MSRLSAPLRSRFARRQLFTGNTGNSTNIGGITNMNGRLTCTYGERGYGSSREYRPQGSYHEYYGYGR